MGDRTAIPWTDATWNPIVGCSKTSPGCAHCYAETMGRRLRAMGRPEYQDAHDGQGWTGRTVFVPERLSQPLRWRKPRMIFVCSMGDLFHESVPFEHVAAVWGVMAACPEHTFQVLTKRPERMAEFLARRVGGKWPLPNVWLGTTTEDQRRADERIPHLLRCPAAVYFVSGEPLLSSLTLPADFLALGPQAWVIVGGESGPDARPMNPAWARGLRDQCRNAGVPYFFKQWGEWAPDPFCMHPDRIGHQFAWGEEVAHLGTRAAGHLLDGVEHREVPR